MQRHTKTEEETIINIVVNYAKEDDRYRKTVGRVLRRGRRFRGHLSRPWSDAIASELLARPGFAEDMLEDSVEPFIKRLRGKPLDSACTGFIGIIATATHSFAKALARSRRTIQPTGTGNIEDAENDAPFEEREREIIASGAKLAAATQKLPPRQREATELFLDGKCYKEIAEAMGITEDGARGHIHKASKKLHRLLEGK